jgi:hypothetical protein
MQAASVATDTKDEVSTTADGDDRAERTSWLQIEREISSARVVGPMPSIAGSKPPKTVAIGLDLD